MRRKANYVLTCLSLLSIFSLSAEENIANAPAQKTAPSTTNTTTPAPATKAAAQAPAASAKTAPAAANATPQVTAVPKGASPSPAPTSVATPVAPNVQTPVASPVAEAASAQTSVSAPAVSASPVAPAPVAAPVAPSVTTPVQAPTQAPMQTAVKTPAPSQDALEARVGMLAQKFDEMQKHFHMLEKSTDTASLQTWLKNLGKDLNSMQTQLAQLQQQMPTTTDSMQKLANDMKEMQAQMFVMDKRLQEMPGKVAMDRMTAQLKDMQTQITSLKQDQRKEKHARVVLASAETRGNLGLFLESEYLCWKAKQGGMEYAVTAATSPLITTTTALTGAEEKKIEFNWESGFRVGGGYQFPFDNWQVSVEYTHFHTKATSTQNTLSDPNVSIFPLLVYQAADVVSVEQAHARWSIRYNTLDADLKRDFYVSKHLAVYPSVGVKQAWIRQHTSVNYSAGTPVGGTPTLLPGQIYVIHNKNDFRGFGLKAGIGSTWNWKWGFSFFGDASAALLYGLFERDQQQFLQSPFIKTNYVDLNGDVHKAAPMAQFQLGVAWGRDFWDAGMHIGIKLGYENQYWWNQNQMARFTSSGAATFPSYVTPTSDLSYQGLTLAVRLDF